MNRTLSNQVIALAGVTQAVYLVQQIAKRGAAEASAIETSIASIFTLDAANVEDVYGGVSGLQWGLKKLSQHLEGRSGADLYEAQYAARLLALERKFIANHNMVENIRAGIQRIAPLAEQRTVLHLDVLAELGELYQSTISTLQPRVMIHGEPSYLTNPVNVNKIRALLLAGIRSVVLWRQCGGARWRLVFYRRPMLDQAERLYRQATITSS